MQRTCIGCRAVDQPDHLVRLTVQAGAAGIVVVIDHKRSLGGRGAWLHPAPECVEKAARRHAFNRAFKTRVDAAAAVQQIEQAIQPLDAVHK
ncbi:MAG: YlxR family protein [Kocuria sp.]|nr:YlxR family protein [Kocuria sp.]MDO5618774.1 YlxR family protein [Kocuria sp.]